MSPAEIQKLVQTSIEVKILEAFRSTPDLVEDLVKSCLNQEVTEYGGKPDYNTRVKMPYLTYLTQNAVQNVAMLAVREYMIELEPMIKEKVKKALESSSVIDALTKSIIGVTQADYKIELVFKPGS